MSLAFSNSERRELGFGFLPFETRVSPTHLAGGILPNKVILKDDIDKSAIPQDGIRRNGLESCDFRWTWRDFLRREIGGEVCLLEDVARTPLWVISGEKVDTYGPQCCR